MVVKARNIGDLKGFTKGLGGTDAAALLGIHPYRSRIDVWAELLGYKEHFKGNFRTDLGLALESWCRDRYEKDNDTKVLGPFKTVVDGWFRRSPDGINLEKNLIYEGKVSLGYHAYEMFPPGDLEQWRACQCQWYMAKPYNLKDLVPVGAGSRGTGRDIKAYGAKHGWSWRPSVAHLTALVTGPDIRLYPIERDQGIIDAMLWEAEEFWKNHVETGIEPGLDGSDSVRKYLNSKWERANEVYVDSTVDVDEFVASIRSTREEIVALREKEAELKREREVLEEVESRYKNEIRNTIEDNLGVKGHWGHATWKEKRGSMRLKSALMKKEVERRFGSAVLKEIVEAASPRSEPTRELRFTWKRGE